MLHDYKLHKHLILASRFDLLRLVVLIWNIKWMYILLNDCAIMFLCFCPFRALLFQYDSQGVASLALGYGQVALSGRCCGQKAQRAHTPLSHLHDSASILLKVCNLVLPWFSPPCR